jgi:hypothetical protein
MRGMDEGNGPECNCFMTKFVVGSQIASQAKNAIVSFVGCESQIGCFSRHPTYLDFLGAERFHNAEPHRDWVNFDMRRNEPS